MPVDSEDADPSDPTPTPTSGMRRTGRTLSTTSRKDAAKGLLEIYGIGIRLRYGFRSISRWMRNLIEKAEHSTGADGTQKMCCRALLTNFKVDNCKEGLDSRRPSVCGHGKEELMCYPLSIERAREQESKRAKEIERARESERARLYLHAMILRVQRQHALIVNEFSLSPSLPPSLPPPLHPSLPGLSLSRSLSLARALSMPQLAALPLAHTAGTFPGKHC